MANDYGYFGNGSTGNAHYKQSFDRNFGGSGGAGHHNSGRNGSGCGTLMFILIVAVVAALILLAE